MNDQNMVNLINDINHISLNHQDLMDASLEFSKIYLKNNPDKEQLIIQFFKHGDFLHQSVLAAREGIVLGMNAITLDPKISFEELIKHCVDVETQRIAEWNVCADDETALYMRDFLKELRKEVFSRIYSQNKDLKKMTGLSKKLLKERYDQFMSYSF